MANTIIDRRKNPGSKSSDNRQKFIKRTKKEIRKSIHDTLGKRSIKGSSDSQDVVITRKGIDEPQFGHNPQSGSRDIVLPGNKEFVEGDLLRKPPSGQGQGKGEGEASNEGIGEDEFGFALSNDEIALKGPKLKKIKELEAELETCKDKERRVEIEEEISRLRIRANAVSFVDPVDLRYNNFSKKPAPISQAVVFFVMDVSASMTQAHKDLAKRFFMLLNLFVSRKYKRVDCVFIRHHIQATECDEHDFFNNKENGGTVVSSAFKLAKEIIDDRYSPNEWNLYFSQASDGDNWDNDNEELMQVLTNDILPITQYFSYIQVGTKRHGYYNTGNLLQEYEILVNNNKNIVTKHIEDTFDIYPVFREIFKIKDKNE